MQRQEILAALRERIIGFAASLVRRDVAEDLAQEVLLVLHEKYPHVEALDELVPLSLQITRFKVMSRWEKSRRRGESSQVTVEDLPVADPREDALAQLVRKERLERLRAALPTLGARCRELFRLQLQGQTFAEIQARMKAASINTVYTWAFRCREELLARMGGDWEGGK